MATIEELKQEATELGLTFNQNIGVEKLSAKIEEYYKSQETSEKEILKAIAEKEKALEKSEEKSAVKGTTRDKYKRAEEAARKTRIITVIDNDQRVNNQTTVATVNCSNMYFDLGTVHIPLNVPVEVRQGHINALRGVEIPLHSIDSRSGMTKGVNLLDTGNLPVRPRYTISYEDIEK